MKKRKAIFFDRDGIVNVKLENDYVKNFDEFVFRKHFLNLFSLIKSKGYLAILVTNQQCVDKGIIDEKELVNIHNLMQEQIFWKTNYNFDGLYFCPHLHSAGCKCRKPEIEMFEKAINDYDIAVEKSWMLGDAITDVIAGKKIGLKTILVNCILVEFENADYIVRELDEIIEIFQTTLK